MKCAQFITEINFVSIFWRKKTMIFDNTGCYEFRMWKRINKTMHVSIVLFEYYDRGFQKILDVMNNCELLRRNIKQFMRKLLIKSWITIRVNLDHFRPNKKFRLEKLIMIKNYDWPALYYAVFTLKFPSYIGNERTTLMLPQFSFKYSNTAIETSSILFRMSYEKSLFQIV